MNENFIDRINWINLRTATSFDLPCCICGTMENIEMHHINHVRKTNYKKLEKTWEQVMSLKNRKQIPVCQSCHLNVIHTGKYGGQKLRDFTPNVMYDNRIINIENYVNKCPDTDHTKTLLEKGWTPTRNK